MWHIGIYASNLKIFEISYRSRVYYPAACELLDKGKLCGYLSLCHLSPPLATAFAFLCNLLYSNNTKPKISIQYTVASSRCMETEKHIAFRFSSWIWPTWSLTGWALHAFIRWIQPLLNFSSLFKFVIGLMGKSQNLLPIWDMYWSSRHVLFRRYSYYTALF